MSFLLLQGQVVECQSYPSRTDKKTGEVRPPYSQVQIMGQEPLTSGDNRVSLFTLSVDDRAPFDKLKGQTVRIPVGAYVKHGAVAFFAKKGEVPTVPKGPL